MTNQVTGIPHLMYPPQVGGDGHLSTVEQDSEQDILGCVTIACMTPLGTRLYVPTFGISDYTFDQAPVPVEQLMQEIQTSEPRATGDVTVQVQDLVETVVAGVSNVG